MHFLILNKSESMQASKKENPTDSKHYLHQMVTVYKSQHHNVLKKAAP